MERESHAWAWAETSVRNDERCNAGLCEDSGSSWSLKLKIGDKLPGGVGWQFVQMQVLLFGKSRYSAMMLKMQNIAARLLMAESIAGPAFRNRVMLRVNS